MSHFINSVPFLRQALTHMEVCVRDSTGLGYPRKVGRGQDARPVDIQLNSGSALTWAEGFTHSGVLGYQILITEHHSVIPGQPPCVPRAAHIIHRLVRPASISPGSLISPESVTH